MNYFGKVNVHIYNKQHLKISSQSDKPITRYLSQRAKNSYFEKNTNKDFSQEKLKIYTETYSKTIKLEHN